MRVLLSTIGSRGDVQPLAALAVELRDLGQDVRMCVPPDFREWIEGLGVRVTCIGPEVRPSGKISTSVIPTAEERRRMIEGTVAAQFETIAHAARDCDVIVGATALQIAAPSVAEQLGIPYVFAAYCPTVLPSTHHAPPVLRILGDTPAPALSDYSAFWIKDAQHWNDTWGSLLNSHREALGLSAVSDVRGHVHTDGPWLAADQTLGPWPEATGVFQSGAWILRDDRPLSAELEAFLDAGEPPVYFGFGSNRVPDGLSHAMIKAARSLGRRVIILRGWAELSLIDDDVDCLAIGEVNQQALFKRVAAVVHHGGAGTTTASAQAGAPQVVIPQHYDQHYWAQRVQHLGIGAAHAHGNGTIESLTSALEHALKGDQQVRARSVAVAVRTDGARIAAKQLVTTYG